MQESRKSSLLNFYARPTIPFSLECETAPGESVEMGLLPLAKTSIKQNLIRDIMSSKEVLVSLSFKNLNSSGNNTTVALIVVCVCVIPYYCLYFFHENKRSKNIGTLLITLHAIVGFIYVFTTTSDLRAFPLRKIDAIKRLEMLKAELNPCSDNLTSVNTPSSISILQNEYDVDGLYIWIVLIWVWMFLFIANGI